jgi:hypothetical protein
LSGKILEKKDRHETSMKVEEISKRCGKFQYKETIIITLVNFISQQQRGPHFTANRFHNIK